MYVCNTQNNAWLPDKFRREIYFLRSGHRSIRDVYTDLLIHRNAFETLRKKNMPFHTG